MARKKSSAQPKVDPAGAPPVSLKQLAEHLGLSPATISLVINASPVADSIPQRTKDRVMAAVEEFNYRPNFTARSLRQQRSFIIGVLVPEVSEGYAAMVMSGIEDHLLQEGYFYFVASHRHRPDLIEEYPALLLRRSVEGIIAVDTPVFRSKGIPVVAVSGRGGENGATNILLDHDKAAHLALQHLYDLGHRKIAVIKGQAFSSDTEVRWNAISRQAALIGIEIPPLLVGQLEGDSSSPELGYAVTRRLIDRGGQFTALFAFNDISAMGAIRALREAGRPVPQQVSVVGFDDIQSAAFQNPALTTIRQPLRKMGEIAAEILLGRIQSAGLFSKHVTVAPELIVRESTAAVRAKA